MSRIKDFSEVDLSILTSDQLKDCLLMALIGFFCEPHFELRLLDHNDVENYKARLVRAGASYDALKQKYDNLQASYARECSINLHLQDEIRLLKKGK